MIGAAYRIQTRMMGAYVLAQHNALIEGTRTHGTGIGLLARVNAFVLAQRTAIGKRLPTVATAIWPFACVDADMYLLRAARAKGLATLVAGKQLARRCGAM